MSEHTPGPYHIGYRMKSDGTKEAHSIYSDAGDAICEGLTWNGNGETDAHLLAASWEMLEALNAQEKAEKWIAENDSESNPFYQATYEQMLDYAANLRLAAIAKANGEEAP